MQKREQTSTLEANLLEVANYLYSHNVFILIVAFVCSITAFFWGSLFTQPVYTAQSVVVVKVKSETPIGPDITAAWNRQLEIENKLYMLSVFTGSNKFKSAIGNDIKSLESIKDEYTEAKEAIKVVRDYNPNWESLSAIEIGEKILAGVEFTLDMSKNVVQVTSKNTKPALAQATANLAAFTLVEVNYQMILKELNSVLSFVEDQTESTREKLFTLEQSLSRIQKNEKILSVSDTSARIDGMQVEYVQGYSRLLVEKETVRIWIKELEKTIGDFKKNLQSGIDNHVYLMQLQKRLELLSYQRSTKKQIRNVAQEEINELDDEIKNSLTNFQKAFNKLKMKNSLNPWDYLKTLEEGLEKAQQRLNETDAKLTAFNKVKHYEIERYKTLPTILKNITQLRRDIDLTSNLYQQLKSKLQETQIIKSGKANDLEVLRYSDPITRPIGVSWWVRVLFTFIGSVLAAMLLLTLRYVLIPTVRNRLDLINCGVDILGEIPFVKISSSNKKTDANHPLLLKLDASADDAHSIRKTRFSLQEKMALQTARDQKVTKILTVCSANSKEGKSFFAANLAYSLSIAQFRVLVFDLDILNRSIRDYFQFSTAEKAVENIPKENDNFYFDLKHLNEFLDMVEIPYTEKSIADILETPLLGEYLNSMKSNYDIIIIDTPPVRNSLEALIASRFSDGIIFVANQRKSLRYDVQKALDTIQETYHNRIFGVLNFSYDELNASHRRRRKQNAA